MKTYFDFTIARSQYILITNGCRKKRFQKARSQSQGIRLKYISCLAERVCNITGASGDYKTDFGEFDNIATKYLKLSVNQKGAQTKLKCINLTRNLTDNMKRDTTVNASFSSSSSSSRSFDRR